MNSRNTQVQQSDLFGSCRKLGRGDGLCRVQIPPGEELGLGPGTFSSLFFVTFLQQPRRTHCNSKQQIEKTMKTKNVPIIGAARPTPWTRRALWTQQTEWSAVNGRPAPSGNRLVVSVPVGSNKKFLRAAAIPATGRATLYPSTTPWVRRRFIASGFRETFSKSISPTVTNHHQIKTTNRTPRGIRHTKSYNEN